jgi:hypothetical protein
MGITAAALGACSTMSESECRTVDWRTIGYEDGVGGYSGDRISVHRKACAKYGVSTDLAAYQAGRDDGLREYCQPANGFRVGSHGNEYTGYARRRSNRLSCAHLSPDIGSTPCRSEPRTPRISSPPGVANSAGSRRTSSTTPWPSSALNPRRSNARTRCSRPTNSSNAPDTPRTRSQGSRTIPLNAHRISRITAPRWQ